MGILQEWWFPMLTNPAWLAERGSEYHAYAVISICRALHGLEYGTIVSKPVAARWAQTEFSQWQPLIEKAIQSQTGNQPEFTEAALEFINFCYVKITQ